MRTDQRMPDHHSVPEALKDGNDLYKERALEDIVETIMLYGEYPARASKTTRLFDLREWIQENMDADEIADFMVGAFTDWGLGWDEQRLKLCDNIEKQITAELRDSQMVLDKADELAREAEEDSE